MAKKRVVAVPADGDQSWIPQITVSILGLGVAVLVVCALLAAGLSPRPRQAEALMLLHLGEDGICSGVHIGNGRVLTAGHCTSHGNIVVENRDGIMSLAVVSWVSQHYDVALLETDIMAESAELSCRLPAQDERVMAAGHPRGLEWLHMFGHVAKQTTMDIEKMGWGSVMVLDIAIGPGMSGGPLFDDRGKVVGINVGTGGRDNKFEGVGISVPGKTICNLLARN